MKKLVLCFALGLLALCVACGNGSNTPPPVGSFSNASMNGTYTYQMSGVRASGSNAISFTQAGSFMADGNGHITSGVDDFYMDGNTAVSSGTSSGSYSLANDGTGTITLNTTDAGTITLAVTLVSSSKLYLVDGDTFAVANGLAEKQDTTAFTAVPSGTFVFKLHEATFDNPVATVGLFTASGGTFSGTDDVLNFPNTSFPATLTGSFNAPNSSSGRGTGTFTDSTNFTTSFIYYIVNSSNIRFFSTSPSTFGLGRAELQTGTFSNASLSGGYAFGTLGDSSNNFGGVSSVGVFTATGNGSITGGVYDSVQDGNPSSNVPLSGTYSVASNGRVAVTLNGNIQEIFWLVNPSRALFLVDDANKVEDGTIDRQLVSSFSNSTMLGQFAFAMGGVDPTSFIGRVGTLQWGPVGNLNLFEFVNASGTANTASLSGNFSVASNGRATATLPFTNSTNLVFYLTSGNDGYLLIPDQGNQINGTLSKQQ